MYITSTFSLVQIKKIRCRKRIKRILYLNFRFCRVGHRARRERKSREKMAARDPEIASFLIANLDFLSKLKAVIIYLYMSYFLDGATGANFLKMN